MLSDLRRHTDEILRVKQLNESIVENLPIGVAAFDAAGEQLCINSKAKALLEPGVWRSEAGEALSALLTSWLASGRLLVIRSAFRMPPAVRWIWRSAFGG